MISFLLIAHVHLLVIYKNLTLIIDFFSPPLLSHLSPMLGACFFFFLSFLFFLFYFILFHRLFNVSKGDTEGEMRQNWRQRIKKMKKIRVQVPLYPSPISCVKISSFSLSSLNFLLFL